jgi:hypothetical protein
MRRDEMILIEVARPEAQYQTTVMGLNQIRNKRGCDDLPGSLGPLPSISTSIRLPERITADKTR